MEKMKTLSIYPIYTLYAGVYNNPAGTWRKYNVASTSMQCHDVASTLRRHYIYVMKLHRRWGNVIFTSCASRETISENSVIGYSLHTLHTQYNKIPKHKQYHIDHGNIWSEMPWKKGRWRSNYSRSSSIRSTLSFIHLALLNTCTSL